MEDPTLSKFENQLLPSPNDHDGGDNDADRHPQRCESGTRVRHAVRRSFSGAS